MVRKKQDSSASKVGQNNIFEFYGGIGDIILAAIFIAVAEFLDANGMWAAWKVSNFLYIAAMLSLLIPYYLRRRR